jgi:hypothetical protein
MIWLTWRQFRTAALAVFGGLAAFAVLLSITGPGMASEYATGFAACTAQGNCGDFLQRFYGDHQSAFLAVTAVILLLPALIGIFWGAPLISRELETGTHRLVWNQSITRTYWLAVKLSLIGLAVMAVTGLAGLGVTWWSSSIDPVAAEQFPRLGSVLFDARGIVPIGYSAFGFILGVVVGMLIRRALPAMAVTLAVFVVIQVAMPTLVRPHLLPATHTTVEISQSILDGFASSPQQGGQIHVQAKAPDPGGWLLASQTLDSSGQPVDTIPKPTSGACAPRQDGISGCLAELTRLGYREQLTYHAPTRFWPFQWIETGIYLALALCLAAFCFWWLRRRMN